MGGDVKKNKEWNSSLSQAGSETWRKHVVEGERKPFQISPSCATPSEPELQMWLKHASSFIEIKVGSLAAQTWLLDQTHSSLASARVHAGGYGSGWVMGFGFSFKIYFKKQKKCYTRGAKFTRFWFITQPHRDEHHLPGIYPQLSRLI